MARGDRSRIPDALAGNLHLYTLPLAPVADRLLRPFAVVSCGEFDATLRSIDSWEMIHLCRPLLLGASEPMTPLSSLRPEAKAMQDAAAPLLNGEAPGYRIVHIPTLQMPASRNRPGEVEKARLDVMVATRQLLDDLDPLHAGGPLHAGAPRGYFLQYDDTLHRGGFLAVGARAAVLVGLSDESFATFASLLQAGMIAPSGGFTEGGLNNAMLRVSLWSANQDIHKSVDEVNELRRSGGDSTRGQIGVSFALAFIGIALSLIPYIKRPLDLAPGLGALGISGVLYALHAQSGSQLARRAGLVLLIVGIVTLFAGVAVAVLPTMQVLHH